ncbi:uncharacterized protein LOC135161269 [Diachasmimorpha longicaudata]|uniref:uncharacterized protein LOC135161269 n=1 Tax=Diachasmimorpha longicaudata TaxID=58733 RepID=UPI0030B8DD70
MRDVQLVTATSIRSKPPTSRHVHILPWSTILIKQVRYRNRFKWARFWDVSNQSALVFPCPIPTSHRGLPVDPLETSTLVIVPCRQRCPTRCQNSAMIDGYYSSGHPIPFISVISTPAFNKFKSSERRRVAGA